MHSLNPGGLSARPLALRGLRPAGAPSRSTTSSSAPRRARTSISTAWWRSARHAMPKRMPPYARGRLVIIPLGDGRFTVEVTREADKWAIRA
jgi:hypothetical protein